MNEEERKKLKELKRGKLEQLYENNRKRQSFLESDGQQILKNGI